MAAAPFVAATAAAGPSGRSDEWRTGGGFASTNDMQTYMHAHQQQQEYIDSQGLLLDLFQRLDHVCKCTSAKFGGGSVCVFQPWVSSSAFTTQGGSQQQAVDQLFASPMLGLDGGQGFQAFRQKSCMSPLGHSNSMPGRVLRTGALQVVQSLKVIPQGIHPRSNLSDEDLAKVAEALYIPVYDALRPQKGAVSVLEVFLSTKATESMLVADFISFVDASLASVSLLLSNPQPQPIHRSSLCGRRARAPADSDEDLRAVERRSSSRAQQGAAATPAGAGGGTGPQGGPRASEERLRRLSVPGASSQANNNCKDCSSSVCNNNATSPDASKVGGPQPSCQGAADLPHRMCDMGVATEDVSHGCHIGAATAGDDDDAAAADNVSEEEQDSPRRKVTRKMSLARSKSMHSINK